MKLYKYEYLGISWGIVFANTKMEAEEKVRNMIERYHSDVYDICHPIYIKELNENNSYFSNCPDVHEIYY